MLLGAVIRRYFLVCSAITFCFFFFQLTLRPDLCLVDFIDFSLNSSLASSTPMFTKQISRDTNMSTGNTHTTIDSKFIHDFTPSRQVGVGNFTQPLFINFATSSVTNFVLSRADLLLSSAMLSGMCIKGILYPFSMTSIMYSFAPISFHSHSKTIIQ
jgi:hypothetical protein